MQAAFQEVWKQAEAADFPEQVRLRYTRSEPATMSQAQVAALRERVEEKPDHPDRTRLAMQERRIAHGDDTFGFSVWYWNNANWRFNQDTSDPNLPFWDQTATPQAVWSNTPSQLAVLDGREEMPSGRNYRESSRLFRDHLRLIMYGGMAEGLAGALAPGEMIVDGPEWHARAASRDGNSVMEWRGSVLPDGMLVVNQRRVINDTKYPAAIGLTTTFRDWRSYDGFPRPLAGEIVEADGAGRVRWRVRLEDAGPLRRADFDRVSATPTVGGDDPVRGVVKPDSVVDYRPNESKILIASEGEYLESDMPQWSRVQGTSWRQYVGWAVLIVIPAFGYFIRRHMKGR
jgi:hypothetical protein